MTRLHILSVTLLTTLVVPACSHFRVAKDAYRSTKTVAVVEVMGKPAKDAQTPLDLANIGAASPWERIVTNDALALQEYLKSKGFEVVPLDEMVQANGYLAKGEHAQNGVFAPRGMRRFTVRDGGCDISFMTANALAKELGVDAVICLHEVWAQESAKLGLETLASTTVALSMFDRRSNEVWTDLDTSTAGKPIAGLAGLKSVSTDEFVGAYNEAFLATLGKMKERLEREL